MGTKKKNLQGIVTANNNCIATICKGALPITAKVPTLDIEGLPFHENYYSSRGKTYDVPTLVAFAKYKGYKSFDLPLIGIDMSRMPFVVDTFIQLLYQLKRINDTNLDYPILLDEEGTICDGWHRIAKAYLEGRTTIKAIRLLEMPDASGKVDTK